MWLISGYGNVVVGTWFFHAQTLKSFLMSICLLGFLLPAQQQQKKNRLWTEGKPRTSWALEVQRTFPKRYVVLHLFLEIKKWKTNEQPRHICKSQHLGRWSRRIAMSSRWPWFCFFIWASVFYKSIYLFNIFPSISVLLYVFFFLCWSWTCNPPSPVFWRLELQEYTTTSNFWIFYTQGAKPFKNVTATFSL